MTATSHSEKLYCLPLDVATTPPSGRCTCIANAWWVVHPDQGLILFRMNPRTRYCSPQYNSSEMITRQLIEKLYPWAEARQIPFAFFQEDLDGGIILPSQAKKIELVPA